MVQTKKSPLKQNTPTNPQPANPLLQICEGVVCFSGFLWRWCCCKAIVSCEKLAASFLLYFLCLFSIVFALFWWQITHTVLSVTFIPAPCCLPFFICLELLWLLSSCLPGLAVLVWAPGSWVALELGNLCAAAAWVLPGGGVWGALSEMFMGRWLQRTWTNEWE